MKDHWYGLENRGVRNATKRKHRVVCSGHGIGLWPETVAAALAFPGTCRLVVPAAAMPYCTSW